MPGKQRPPRPARRRAAERAAERRTAPGPADAPSWLDSMLSHGNQAAGQQLVGRTLAEDRAPEPGDALDRDDDVQTGLSGDYDEIWAEVQDMIAHGAFSFRQLLALIAAQPELSSDERIRMQEQARQSYRGG